MLTLVIPVYNMESFLDRCMRAMLAQECRDFEIVLVDDGSTDRSGLLCDGYAAAHPGRIRVIHKPNGGLPSARNAGIDAARGEYISFPDPDDWVEPDYVARLLALQKAHDADMVCTGYFVATDEGSVPVYPDAEAAVLSGKRAQRKLMELDMKGFVWNKLFRLDIIRDHGLRFLDDVGTTEDLDFAYRYLLYAERVCHAPGLRTYHYYQRPGAATNSGYAPKKLESFRTYEKILASTSDRELIDAAREELCVAAVNLLWAWELGDHGDREGRQALLDHVRRQLPAHLRSRRYGPGRKLQALLAAISPRLYARLKNAVRN